MRFARSLVCVSVMAPFLLRIYEQASFFRSNGDALLSRAIGNTLVAGIANPRNM